LRADGPYRPAPQAVMTATEEFSVTTSTLKTNASRTQASLSMKGNKMGFKKNASRSNTKSVCRRAVESQAEQYDDLGITTAAGKSTVLLWEFERNIIPQGSLSLEQAKCEGPKPTVNFRNGAKTISETGAS
jgi:hypothetical protein